MVQELLSLLPKEMGTAALAFAAVGAFGGAVLWVIGARFSVYFITLSAVAIGTSIGVALPRWCAWKVDGSGTAVGGAILLGASAYWLHRAWVGAWFGSVLALWAALATWVILAGNSSWTWPAHQGVNLPNYLLQVWHTLPPDITHALPVVCSIAFLLGAIPATLWPRAGMVFLYSALGATLLAGMGIAAVSMEQPDWLTRIPPKNSLQVTAMVLTVLIGAGVQWQMNFRKPRTMIGKPATPGGH
jgi:hypothetical protein